MLQSVPEEQKNHCLKLQQISEGNSHKFCISKVQAIYYPYNYDIRDQGWGCAWRAIQLLLTYKSIYLKFQDLYLTFSKRTCLFQIIQKFCKYDEKTLQMLNKNSWIPEQLNNHWAQPFIASLICSSFKIKNSLLLLNGYPVANAPSNVFQKTIQFKQFIEIVKNNINHSSIMIDDGTFALSIIGFRQSSEETIEFLFADPHIRSNKQNKTVGLYSKQFDFKGNPKGDSRNQAQKIQGLYNVYEFLQFSIKNWMVCFLDKSIPQ